MEQEPQEVMAELVAKLAKQLGVGMVPAVEGNKDGWEAVHPNLDRLTVGIDLGDRWSNYCILGLGGETLAEGQFRTRMQEVTGFFQVLAISRVVIEVGTHSAWVREIIAGFGHEVLVANSRLMDGRNVAGARAIESMPRNWRGWGGWTRNRYIQFSTAVLKCVRTCWYFEPATPW